MGSCRIKYISYRTDWVSLAEWRELKLRCRQQSLWSWIVVWTSESMRSDSETTRLSWIPSIWLEMPAVNDTSVAKSRVPMFARTGERFNEATELWELQKSKWLLCQFVNARKEERFNEAIEWIMGTSKVKMIIAPVLLRVFSAENKLDEVHPSLDRYLLKNRSPGFLQIQRKRAMVEP